MDIIKLKRFIDEYFHYTLLNNEFKLCEKDKIHYRLLCNKIEIYKPFLYLSIKEFLQIITQYFAKEQIGCEIYFEFIGFKNLKNYVIRKDRLFIRINEQNFPICDILNKQFNHNFNQWSEDEFYKCNINMLDLLLNKKHTNYTEFMTKFFEIKNTILNLISVKIDNLTDEFDVYNC